MTWPGRSVAARRRRAAGRAAPGPLREYLAVPSPSRETPLEDLPLLALDLETTGLDPRSDRVLSAGWVPVDGDRIVLGGARRLLVRDAGEVGQSATVHGITDDALGAGRPLEEVVGELLGALAGRVLLAHFARVETRFLDAACRRFWGARMPVEVVDTLELERRLLPGGGEAPQAPGALRLWTARARRGLPLYSAHEALTDALACAELYLAQRSELEHATPERTTALRHVVA
ncbi:DNA polymerase III subunit epsilon [Phycicoccus endophyticus]|uniref:DNA polymerase III subunit epsilon n=1 Tax=Phycicoccus endophyticus TaxID=1690220 RepID=A0A7G9R0F8_9MICO|nr:exonuclease domain-containing protein [Phycicoccus endophyticus]NHI20101.1 DNA polymerase III subunit epsilon [Phycicoccus endophyticus]QNN49083.1 DNA polymerase III subunit epsilon [Phycicoccus endophyticus]GGL38460.1 DNA polymerase III subunit epsilon [Phycicoccus endophyticus]